MSSVTTGEIRKVEQEETGQSINFKMVTFSLAGKYYGIDIMKVDGIAKANEFTYVPNSPAFVLGVYNLRGEIISIIDLRKMFNLETDGKKEDELEDVIILRLDKYLIGIVVDAIDKVIGINSETIQSPHPILQGVDIAYLSGVVENEDKLYIILDTDRIFGKKETAEPVEEEFGKVDEVLEQESGRIEKAATKIELDFISETLATFLNFHVSSINEVWVGQRFAEWKRSRNNQGLDFQLSNPEDANQFLRPFFSPYTGVLWSDEYIDSLENFLPEQISGLINIWNPGAGAGHESYSIAHVLKSRYRENQIKIWANDKDLLSISKGTNLVFSRIDVPDSYINSGYLKQTDKGYQFVKELRDIIFFEYHDILHGNQYPKTDVIVARDVLSFLKPEQQLTILNEFRENLKTNGILILGLNERIPEEGWSQLSEGNVVAYRKEGE